jgi:hypothetical protein
MLKALIAPYLPWVYGGLAALFLAGQLAFGAWQFHRGAESVRAKDREALEAASSRQAKAVSEADQQRPKDQATTAKLKDQLTHAADALPDSNPSAVRVAPYCQRLCNQGSSIAAVPACAGFSCSAATRPRS